MSVSSQVAFPESATFGAAISRDPELTLLLPENDVEDPEFSIVVPALNEEITIGEFVAWREQGIAAAQVKAEIIIIDSSSDRTAEIAVANGPGAESPRILCRHERSAPWIFVINGPVFPSRPIQSD